MTNPLRAAMMSGLAVVAVISMAATAPYIRAAGTTARPKEAAAAKVPATAAPAPVLSTVPKGVKVSDAVQTLDVGGRSFTNGMSLTVETPDGMMMTYGPSAVDDVTPTTMRIHVAFDQIGTYELTVRNRAGERSNDLKLVVAK